MDQELLRERLNDVIASGLVAKAISKYTNITTDVLSRFKNGYVCLCSGDAEKLKAYLDCGEEIINPILQLGDKDYIATLSPQEKQKYILELSNAYLSLKNKMQNAFGNKKANWQSKLTVWAWIDRNGK